MSTRLQAVYFDTPEGGLRAAGLALRQRREGRRWVQAIKGPGDGLLVRLEHEVDCGASPRVRRWISRAMPALRREKP